MKILLAGATGAIGTPLTRRLLSPRTVGDHLQKVFRKLSIRSRVELAQLAAEESSGGRP